VIKIVLIQTDFTEEEHEKIRLLAFKRKTTIRHALITIVRHSNVEEILKKEEKK